MTDLSCVLAILWHTPSNASATILFDWSILFDTLLTAGVCIANYKKKGAIQFW